jgi:hypothetical protein
MRYWEIRANSGQLFAVGPSELEAWLNLFRIKGKCFTLEHLKAMIESVKIEDDCVVKEIDGGLC